MRHVKPNAGHGSIWSYTIGFILSILLTLIAYFAVVNKSLAGNALIVFIIALAIVQLCVQLFFFLHLGSESKPRWKLLAFLFMLLVLFILVFGSLWIMNNLNYHSMSPTQVDDYLLDEEGIQRQ
jgi:cytochrome o ubiquinol oxidase subunit IV